MRVACQTGARIFSSGEFDRAAKLLQLMVQHAEVSTLAELRLTELAAARRAVFALQNERLRWHGGVGPHRASMLQSPQHIPPETQPKKVIQRLLASIKRDYSKPITLRNLAAELGMNAAYLSDLFSQLVGIPFKSYLTAVRLNEAKALLSDPAKTASDVAYAVGYASENRFRAAFKKATGLCPRVWRETMRVNGPVSSRPQP